MSLQSIEFHNRWRAVYRCQFCGKHMDVRNNQRPGKEIFCYRCSKYSQPIKEVNKAGSLHAFENHD